MEGVSNARCGVFETEAESGRICYGSEQARSLRNKYPSVNADRSDNRGFNWISGMGDMGTGRTRQPHFQGRPRSQLIC